jgi:S-adenosylmethionine hydrolase
MEHKPIITFLSDFGTQDGYVGAVKGVIKSFDKKIEIIDITHDIESFNIKQAAFTILNYYNQYPRGTIHLAVVDPGVGSERNVLIIQTRDYHFVGPDNGIFQYVIQQENHKIYRIVANSIYRNEKGATFHARDIFAPISAKLALGKRAKELGARIDDFKFDDRHKQPISEESSTYEIESIMPDKFGNIIFDYRKTNMTAETNHKIKMIRFKNFESNIIYDYYSQVAKGIPLFLWNSLGFLELAVCEGSAKDYFSYKKTDKAIIIF